MGPHDLRHEADSRKPTYRGLAYLTDRFLQTDQTFLDDVLAED